MIFVLLVALTVFEVVLLVAVLAIYLVLVDRGLKAISKTLGKVTFGVRAVNTQTATIGPSVLRINSTLRDINTALGPLAEKAGRAARQ